ncbi:molybdopterin-dependent oxidoreductase [Thalassococcus lentus]|uniref:Molybdopterin-dependent oxidoreductase n=1 Tax=Thalassococcus lentus TaxID=1210524 RepID=A0ABT4XXN4_9RHOB|nr:molybdopterin-dependent oxidoreductase [Thalassococcus lentus]MDA7426693.1 molybdopterin-dependent oxidoreductase [Thalassococcus lentus]
MASLIHAENGFSAVRTDIGWTISMLDQFSQGRRWALGCLSAAVFLPVALSAESVAPLEKPAGPVVLRFSGELSNTNVGEEAHFDIAMLESLGAITLRTTTIWTDGEQVFRGTPLAEIVRVLGISDGVLRAQAINDYAVEIPLEDASEGSALIAFERNGKPMSVRDKGPLWLVYPYDVDEQFRSEVYYSRSIWQLDRMTVMR